MRYKPGHREETRGRVLLGAGRGFRKHGYEGIGVDGLAKEAGVTSGAFYVHFPSKAAAFQEALLSGMRGLCEGIEALQAEHGAGWVGAFVDLYLGDRRTCDLSEACALQALTPEVVRSGAQVKAVYEAELIKVVDAVAKGLVEGSLAERRGRAWALVAMLSGAVTTARAVADPATSGRIAKSVRVAAMALARS